MKVLRAVAGTASAAVIAASIASGAVGQYLQRLEGNVTTIDISNQVGPRPVDFGDLTEGPLNILAMGSDSRVGDGNTKYGTFEGARADTTMLIHIYGNRQRALVMSIPRDTYVRIPDCISSKGKPVPASSQRFNAAFDIGGPGCTIKTLEALGGIQVQHFGVLDFGGFKRTIDALGGVPICLEKPVDDPKSHLKLPAGTTLLKGEDALAFVRARKTLGDGSDLSRIGRQQIFMSALIRQVQESGLLTNPISIYKVLDQATKSVATDPALGDISSVLALVQSVAGINPKNITFTTLPYTARPDGATVAMDPVKSEPLWEVFRSDTPWPPRASVGVDGKPLVTGPGAVRVRVRSAGVTAASAARLRGQLSAAGFQVTGSESLPAAGPVTLIRFDPEYDESARTLQAAIPGSLLKPDPALASTLLVDVGSDNPVAQPLVVRPPSSSGGATTTADSKVCV